MNDDQERIDRALRGLGADLDRPALSPGFSPVLRERLARQKQRKSRAQRHLLVMQVYWLAICVASLIIIQWWRQSGEGFTPIQAVAIGGGLTLVALPVAALLRTLRIGLVDVVFGTLDRLN